MQEPIGSESRPRTANLHDTLTAPAETIGPVLTSTVPCSASVAATRRLIASAGVYHHRHSHHAIAVKASVSVCEAIAAIAAPTLPGYRPTPLQRALRRAGRCRKSLPHLPKLEAPAIIFWW